MRMLSTHRVLLATAMLMAACAEGSDDASDRAYPATVDEHAEAEAGAAAHDHDAAEAGDGQTLLAIMQQLGANVAALTHGILTEDTAAIAYSASAIADHATIAPDDLERIRAELGPEMAAFERLDVQVHDASIRLREAARSGQLNAVVDRLHDVQRGCVACHTQFRQRLRTNPGRQALIRPL